MTISLDGYTALDVYRVIGFPLDNDGTFDVDEDACGGGLQDLYEGLPFLAPTGLDWNLGAPRLIPVVAQGQVQVTFQLPSTDAKTATLRAAFEKLSTDVKLTNTLVDTPFGTAQAMGIDNDKSGQEVLMGLMVSQLQAKNEDGNLMWASVVLHRATIKPNRPSMTDAPMAKEYNLALSRSTKRLWGETYTEVSHGRTEDIGDVVLSGYKLGMGVWVGNDEYTEFYLPSGKLAYDTDEAKVWDVATGAARAGAWDESTDAETFTPTVTPSAGTVMFVTWQYK